MSNQLPLFDDQSFDDAAKRDELTLASPYEQAIPKYVKHMRYEGFAENTIKAFVSDLKLVGKYAGMDTPLGEFSTRKLQDFLQWMLYERGVPCSPKTYARRLTTIKVFFRWLFETGVTKTDPADPLVHESVSSPLPLILYDAEIGALLDVTEGLRRDGHKPDTRPKLLVMLLLQTGMKKGEIMSLGMASFDLSDPNLPVVWIRYDNPRNRYKERNLSLQPDIVPVLREYEGQYKPTHDKLFDCTARNLEYILRDVSVAAGIDKKVSFEMMRWTSAVRDYQRGFDEDRLRQKLGLSRISWRETGAKIARLAEDAS